MYAKWIADDRWAGNDYKGRVVIRTGDIRKILAKKDDRYMIESGKGSYGWVNACDIEVLEKLVE